MKQILISLTLGVVFLTAGSVHKTEYPSPVAGE